MDLFNNWMPILPQALLPIGILTASFLGSTHCVSMCGPLIFVTARTPRDLVLYQLGRAGAYVVLGLLAGTAGSLLRLWGYADRLDGSWLDLQGGAGGGFVSWMAALMITFVLVSSGWRLFTRGTPDPSRQGSSLQRDSVVSEGRTHRDSEFQWVGLGPSNQGAFEKKLDSAPRYWGRWIDFRKVLQLRVLQIVEVLLSPLDFLKQIPIRLGGRFSSAFATGGLSAFLPCGWLHLASVGALATASPLRGAVFMFFFWAGAVPSLIGIPYLSWKVSRTALMRKKVSPRLAGALLMVSGVAVITWKLSPLLPFSSSSAQKQCHVEQK